jgi:hypothetical protein
MICVFECLGTVSALSAFGNASSDRDLAGASETGFTLISPTLFQHRTHRALGHETNMQLADRCCRQFQSSQAEKVQRRLSHRPALFLPERNSPPHERRRARCPSFRDLVGISALSIWAVEGPLRTSLHVWKRLPNPNSADCELAPAPSSFGPNSNVRCESTLCSAISSRSNTRSRCFSKSNTASSFC